MRPLIQTQKDLHKHVSDRLGHITPGYYGYPTYDKMVQAVSRELFALLKEDYDFEYGDTLPEYIETLESILDDLDMREFKKEMKLAKEKKAARLQEMDL